MAYTPNPADASQPLGSVKASTAAEEFRALKAYVQTLSPNGARKANRRQCVRSGYSSGETPQFVAPTSPTSLNLDFVHGGEDTVIAFANGYDSSGDADKITVLSSSFSGASNILATSLRQNTVSYIYADYSSDAAVTFGHTLVPPQYSQTFEAWRQSLLHFEGATVLDDYGNSWSISGGASISSTQKKFGAQAVNCATGGISTSAITELPDSWTLEAFVYFSSLPTAGNRACIFQFYNAGGFGAQLQLYNNAGTIKLEVNASSDGATQNIASAQVGTKTAWSTATWYHIVLSIDKNNSKLLAYVDGTVDISIATASKICLGSNLRIGYNNAAGNALAGYVDEFRFSPCARYPNGDAYSVPTLAFAMDGDHFLTIPMKMVTPSVASTVAGTAPTLQKINRVYLGEVLTNTIAHTVNLYAMNGTRRRNFATLAANTAYNSAHYLGIPPGQIELKCKFTVKNAANGFLPRDVYEGSSSLYSDDAAGTERGYTVVSKDRNNSTVVIGPELGYFRPDTAAAATGVATFALDIIAERSW